MCTRTVPVNGTNVLRVVDYVGEPGQFWLLGRAIDGLLRGAEAEYAECYCAGVAPEVMEKAGFCAAGPKDEAVIPNYLTPPLYENTEYYYAAQPGGARADVQGGRRPGPPQPARIAAPAETGRINIPRLCRGFFLLRVSPWNTGLRVTPRRCGLPAARVPPPAARKRAF